MSLYFLTPGRLETWTGIVQPSGGWNTVLLPTAVGVLEREDGSVVLVDAGFSYAELEDPKAQLGRIRHIIFKIHGSGNASIVAQLAKRGVAAERVTTIIATHLHLDHIGGFVDFPNAEIIAPDKEFASAKSRGSLAGYMHIDAILKSGRARPIHLESGFRFGFEGFCDLFGDGCVLILNARGHTAGHVAVFLTDAETGRSALMAGDAAYSSEELRSGQISLLARMTAFRKDWLRATWGQINAFEKMHPQSPVILSHDRVGFATLPDH